MSGPPAFVLRGVTARYPGGPPVLRELDLRIEAGERIGIAGPNGAGKTTLLHVMAGLRAPEAGTIEAWGRPLRRAADFDALRARVQLLFEDPDDQLVCATVGDDVAFGPLHQGWSRDRVGQAVAAALERVDLAAARERLTWQLSRGEKKRAALAGVLALDPEVLLLDEPSAGLDAAHTERLAELLAESAAAMLLVSHDEALLRRVATRRLRLEQGRLVPGDGSD